MNIKKNYKCRMGECPFCSALFNTEHSRHCPIFTGFMSDEDLHDAIDYYDKKINPQDYD